jgi:DNA-directed RNA polymerase specialized sigma24 family protein
MADVRARSDEDLVLLCQRQRGGPAAEELEHRCRGWLDALVRKFARRHRLSASDAEDAREDANVALMQAIYGYRISKDGTASSCPFRAFLMQVVQRRLRDGCRGRWRAESHLDRSRNAAAFINGAASEFAGPHRVGEGVSRDDPVMEAEDREVQILIRGGCSSRTGRSAKWRIPGLRASP